MAICTIVPLPLTRGLYIGAQPISDPVRLQREYYRRTAEQYDSWHLNDPEHAFALAFMTR